MIDKDRIEKLFRNDDEIMIQLKENLPGDIYENWVQYFTFESVTEKETIIKYSGEASLKEFKKNYREMFWIALSSAGVYSDKIKFYEEKKPKTEKVKKVKEKPQKPEKPAMVKRENKKTKVLTLFFTSIMFAVFTIGVLLLGINYIANRSFEETFYSVSSIKANNNIRIIQISDLHSASYGKGNSKISERVKSLNPDIIIYTGDCLDAGDNSGENVLSLLKSLSPVAPSYYVYGNNEVEKYYDTELSQKALDKKFGFTNETRDPSKLIDFTDEFEKKIEACGVKVLKNEFDTIKLGKTEVDIYGVLTSNPSAFWSYSGESFDKFIFENTNHLKITAVHEPFIFEEFTPDTFGDVLLCGHTHGGTFRIPVLGPLYTHEGGLFPQRKGDLVYGRYDVQGAPLVVSGGLENKNILRINNEPELVIIDISRF